MSGIKSLLDEGMENLEKGISAQAKTVAKQAAGQVTPTMQKAPTDQGSHEAGQQSAGAPHGDQATKDLVKELYAPSGAHGASGEKKEPSEYVKEKLEEGKTPDEAMELQSLRKKLHDEVYYIPLTQRKSHAQEQHEEEQKKEEQKMEDLQKDEEKKQKDQPIAVQMGANKAERFPGAAG